MPIVFVFSLNRFQLWLYGGHSSGRFDLLQSELHRSEADDRRQANNTKTKIVEQKQIQKHQAVGQWPHYRFSKQVSNDFQITSLSLLSGVVCPYFDTSLSIQRVHHSFDVHNIDSFSLIDHICLDSFAYSPVPFFPAV